MKYRKYRICLLSLIIIAVIGGLFYYYNTGEEEAKAVDGTFVENIREDDIGRDADWKQAFQIADVQVE